jgi:RND family efflux transporter MFP subunit
MAAPPNIRTQLRRLAIDKDRRPARLAAASVRSWRPLRWGFAVAGIVAVGAGLLFVARKAPALLSGADTAPEVRLVTVAVRQPDQPMAVHTATGKIVSDHTVEVSTKVSGQIVGLYFEQGDVVEKGVLLARIEDVVYRALRDQAAATVEKSRASLEYQFINLPRVEKLHGQQNAPDIELADARRAADEARAQLAADEAQLDFAQKALTDCEVLAPIGGVILERNVEVGDFVAAEGGIGANANAQFGTIVDTSKLRVEVDVSELDIARLENRMACVITPDAYKDRRYTGHVMWIDPGADYSKATVQVKVRIDEPDDALRVEGSAQVAFLTGPLESDAGAAASLWIPASACLSDDAGDGGRVFVAAEGRLRQVSVRLGRRVGNQLEVVDGLSAGDCVAAEKLAELRDGQKLSKKK